jgi:hypothetical protein
MELKIVHIVAEFESLMTFVKRGTLSAAEFRKAIDEARRPD